MIIYFEDGGITNEAVYSVTGEEYIKVDAGMGFSHCRNKLKYIDDNFPFNTRVYTNSLDAFSNYWCWDEQNKIPQIYIRDKNNEWKNITHFTDRELRRGLNLEKLYINGEFEEV